MRKANLQPRTQGYTRASRSAWLANRPRHQFHYPLVHCTRMNQIGTVAQHPPVETIWMDVRFNEISALWVALDPQTGILYEHHQSSAEPAIHAQGIRSRGSG